MGETNVGTLAARLKINTSEFNSGIDSAQKSLSGFSGSIKNIAIGTAVGSAIVTGIKTVTNGIVNFGKSSFNAVADAQQLEASLKSLVTTELVKASDGTLSYADASKQASKQTAKLTDYIRDLSIQSPFTNATVTRAFQFNASMGQSIETAKKTTEALLNLGAGLSLSEAEFSGLSIAIGQVGSTGKITQQDLRQFANNRFGLDKLNDVFAKMSESTGVIIQNTDDFNAAMADGKVTADDFYGALSRYAAENYSGSVKEMAGTFRGLSSTLTDISYWVKVDLFKPLGDSFARAASPIVEWLASMLKEGGFKEIGNKIATWFKPGINVIEKFGQDLNKIGWTKALDNLKTNLLNLLPENIATKLTEVGGGFKTAFEWISTNKDTLITALEGIAIALAGLKLAEFAASLTNLVNPLFLILLAAGGIAILISEMNKNWDTEKLSLTDEDLKGVADSAQKVADSKANFKEMWDLLFPPTKVDSALKTAADDFDTVTHATDVWIKKTEDWNNSMSFVIDVAEGVLENMLKVKDLWDKLFGKDTDTPTGAGERKSWSDKPVNVGTVGIEASEIDTAPLASQVCSVMETGISELTSGLDSNTLFAPISNIKVPLPDLADWTNTFSATGKLVTDAGAMVTAVGTELQKINNAENQQPLTDMQQFWIDNFGTLSDTLVFHSIVPDMMLAIHTSIKTWLQTSNDTVKIMLGQMEASFQTTATNILAVLATITGSAAPAAPTVTLPTGTQPAGGSAPDTAGAAGGAAGGFSTLITSVTEFKTQLDLLNISLVYTVALLGNATGISFYLTSIATYLSGTMTTTLQDFQAYLDGDFTGCLTAFNELIYLGGNSIYNSLGAIFGVLSDIYEKMAFVVERINGELTAAFKNIVEPAGIFHGAIEASAHVCNGLASDANAAAIAIWNLIAAMEALNSGNYNRTAPGQGTSDRWKADGGSVKAGTSYVVGEQGAELFTPRRSGWIIPNDEAFGSNSSNGTLIVNINGNNYGESYIKDIVRSEVKQAVNEAVFLGA